MADEQNGEKAEGGPAVFVGSDGLDWSVRLKEPERIEADPESDDLDDLFSVTFALDGPNVDGELEVMVPDAADVEVVAVALDTLHGAFVAWAELIAPRKAEVRAILAEE